MGIKSSTALSPILSGLYFIYNLSESLVRSQTTSCRNKLEDTYCTLIKCGFGLQESYDINILNKHVKFCS